MAIRSYSNLQEIHSDVAELFAASEKQYPEFSAGWFDNLQKTVFNNNPTVRYYALHDNGFCKAILPIYLEKQGLIRSIKSLGNYYTSLYSPLLSPHATANDLALLLKAAIKDYGGAHAMRFAPMDPDSPAYGALLTALCEIGWTPFRFFCFGNWHQPVKDSWQSYLGQREGLLRNTIKRKGKKFFAAGGTLEIVTDPLQIKTATEAFVHVYARSWKRPEPFDRFIPSLTHWLASKGWLRLGIARLSDTPVAAEIWIVANGRASIFKLAHDQDYSYYAPGTLLTAYMMKNALDNDHVQDIDYLIGDDSYKKSWLNERRERWGIVAYNPRTMQGLALFVMETMRRKVSQLFRQSSTYYDMAGTLSTHKVPPPSNSDVANRLIWHFYRVSDFSGLSHRWQALNDATIASPLLSADFTETALRHFGRGDELICLAESSGEIVAGTILQKKNLFTWQTFQPSQMPLGPWLQHSQEDLASIGSSLLRQLPGVALILSITRLDSDFYPQRNSSRVMAVDSITTGRVRLAPDMDAFVSTGPVKDNPKLYSELMRRMRKAEKEHGQIILDVETSSTAAKAFVNRYAAIESRSWKAAGGSAITPDDAQAIFYSDLMERLAPKGEARMYTLKFGDVLVAHQIATAKEDVLILLKTTYNPDFRNLGPGVIQTYQIVKHAIESMSGLRIVEMYGRFNDSQKLWVAETRAIYHANLYRFNFLSTLHRKWIALRSHGED